MSGPAGAHPLFAGLPAAGVVTLSTGPAPRPYTVTEGEGVFVYGLCDGAVLSRLTADEDMTPVRTQDGRGVLVLCLCDFTTASHGPHREAHLVALVEDTPGPPVPADAASLVAATVRNGPPRFLSLALWNDSPEVVAYNSDYLGLGARLARIDWRVDRDRLAVQVAEGAAPVLSADLPFAKRSDTGLMLRVVLRMGLAATLRAARAKWSDALIISRKATDVLSGSDADTARNRAAQTRTGPDLQALVPMRAPSDRVDLLRAGDAPLAFSACAAQRMAPFRFAYLHPEESFTR